MGDSSLSRSMWLSKAVYWIPEAVYCNEIQPFIARLADVWDANMQTWKDAHRIAANYSLSLKETEFLQEADVWDGNMQTWKGAHRIAANYNLSLKET